MFRNDYVKCEVLEELATRHQKLELVLFNRNSVHNLHMSMPLLHRAAFDSRVRGSHERSLADQVALNAAASARLEQTREMLERHIAARNRTLIADTRLLELRRAAHTMGEHSANE